ncbi:MAG: SH3 domain-containing protein [Myxococcota bacterium]|jgi:hypothetical protein|nr:SH3 domain-containing protein [Myxococcota bacterium]
MIGQTQEPRRPSGSSKARGDKFEIVKFLLIALVCFGVGFALVYVFFGPPVQGQVASAPQQAESQASADIAADGPLPTSAEVAPQALPGVPTGQVARYAPEGAGPGYEVGAVAAAPSVQPVEAVPGAPLASPNAEERPSTAASDAPAVDRGALPPAVPPGKTPPGMAVDGSAFYVKCWDGSATEIKGESCDRLDLFEKRFGTRLYVVDKCRVEKAGAEAVGKLSLGVEVDFSALSISVWNGPSSDLPSADEVARCLKTELRGLPVDGVPHKNAKYRMFFTVLFGKKALNAMADKPPQTTANKGEPSKPEGAPASGRKGKTIKVVKDKVRVRKTPVDGEEIGKISAGNEVQFLGRKGDWCEVVTPAGNEGWMICDALGL